MLCLLNHVYICVTFMGVNADVAYGSFLKADADRRWKNKSINISDLPEMGIKNPT